MARKTSSSEVAAALGVSAATVQKYARDGRIPYTETPGGHRRFDINEVRTALGVAKDDVEAAGQRHRATALVLTALDLEYDAVAGHLPDRVLRRGRHGTRYEVGSFAGEHIDWSVAIAEIGAGNIGAAVEAATGIDELAPDIVLFVGVAGSLKDDVEHGSVVVADKVYDIHSGKAADDFLSRPVTFPVWHGLEQLVREVRRREWWSEGDQPQIWLRAIAAGQVVVASKTSEIYRLISERCNDAVAVDMESAGVYDAAHRAHCAALAVRGISDMVADKTSVADETWQPRAAAHAAAFAYAILRFAHGDDLHLQPPPTPYQGDWAELLARVPPPTAAAAERARLERPDETYRLLDSLQYSQDGAGDAARKLAGLIDDPPAWLETSHSSSLWAAIGEYAAAHNLHRYAVPAFQKSAEVASESRGWWIARAALAAAASGDAAEADSLLDQSRRAGLEKTLHRLVTAAINEDAEGIIEAGQAAESLDALVDVLLVRALAVVGRREEALELAQQSLEDHPSRGFTTGLAVFAAELLIQRASEAKARSGAWDLDEARDLALRARDVRRQWGGPSGEAASIAAAAAAAMGDLDGVLRIAMASPEGEATSTEAASEELKVQAAHAAVILGRLELARSLGEDLVERSERLLVHASCARAEGNEEEAIELYLNATEAADTEHQRVQALAGLAETGVSPVPGLEALGAEDAEFIRALSDYSRGELDDAVIRLRGLSDRRALDLLVDVYRAQDRVNDAVTALRDAADQYGGPELRFRAALLLGSVGRFDDCLNEAEALLPEVRPSGYLYTEVRHMAIEAAARAGSWTSLVKHAQAAVREGHDEPQVRWALVAGLYNMRELEAARAELQRAKLRPRDEEEARLSIQLIIEGGPSEEAVEAVLDVADQFPNSEEVNAAAFGAVMQLSAGLEELQAPVVVRMQRLTEAFFDRWPDSDMVKRIDASDPTNVIEYLRESFREPAHAWEDLREDVVTCQLPYGLLAAARRRSLGEALIIRAAGCIPLGAVSLDESDVHVQTAFAALDGEAVADTTSLYVGGVLAPVSRRLLATFTRILVPRPVLDDAIEARDGFRLKATGTLGWDAAADRPVMVELDEEEVERRLREAEKLLEMVHSSRVRELTTEDEADPVAQVVLAPLQLAKKHDVPLWTDDFAVRAVASSEGVASFGTVHLMAALRLAGLLSDAEMEETFRALLSSWVGDVPFNAELLKDVGNEVGWIGGVETLPLTRPGLWGKPPQAFEVLHLGLREASRRNPDALKDWCYAACLGASRALHEPARKDAVSTVVVAGFFGLGADPAFLPLLLNGARALPARFGLDDPLPAVATKVRDALEEQTDPATAAQLYVRMVEQLEPGDRQVASAVLFRARGAS